jgi:hypothetical protein
MEPGSTSNNSVLAAPMSTSAACGVRVAALDDIVGSKEWANRPKDRDALPELRQLLQGRSEPGA